MNSDPNNLNSSVPNTTAPQPGVVQPTPTASTTPAAPVVPSAVVSAETVAAPNKSEDIQRVQLVNDKVALKAISPADMASKTDKVEETTETLEPKVEGSPNSADDKKKGGGVFQNIFLFLLFGGLLAFIIYIDDITVWLESKKNNQGTVVEEITTGTLSCESEKSTSNMDYTYTAKFEFRDSKLKRLNYTMEIRGDANLDEADLTELNNECLQIKENASSLSGIDITCSLENGLLKEKQVFTYDSINREEAMSAFIEAGGIYPEYKKDQNIDEIERDMNAAAYTCKRIK